jgi:hypothetical protein
MARGSEAGVHLVVFLGAGSASVQGGQQKPVAKVGGSCDRINGFNGRPKNLSLWRILSSFAINSFTDVTRLWFQNCCSVPKQNIFFAVDRGKHHDDVGPSHPPDEGVAGPLPHDERRKTIRVFLFPFCLRVSSKHTRR